MIFYEVREGASSQDSNYIARRFKKLLRAVEYCRKSSAAWVDLVMLRGDFNEWDYAGTLDPFTGEDRGY